MTDMPAPYCMINDNVIMSLFIINIIGMSYVLLMNGTNIFETFKSHFYYNRSSAPFNDRTHITRICNMLMYIQTILYISIIIMNFFMQDSYKITEENSTLLLGTIMAVIGGVLFLKRIAYSIVNKILFTANKATEWKGVYLFTIKMTGFALAPAVVTVLFLPGLHINYVLYYTILILFIYICIIINSLIKIIFTKKRNCLDIFLYLCALEFLPFAMAWKFIGQLSDFII